ncbi:hypothetical protein [Legionella longbeachae]|uniref:hypothetical protein n=1 Tax=Legionella longbeachae TaxID=450 RepID=UPI001246E644|nr:hypothetical protein [Legionella longbeachae]QEY51068.1 hypothetical protein FQU71_07275 [Legionella longbeachae]
MQKVTINTENTEIKNKKGRYDTYIQEMKTYESNLTFFNQLLDKALKNPNDNNMSELEKYTEQLPFSDKPKGPEST